MKVEARVKHREQSKGVVVETEIRLNDEILEREQFVSDIETIKQMALEHSESLFRKAYKDKEAYNMHKVKNTLPR